MKAIINKLAQAHPELTESDFLAKYRKEHPTAGALNADHLRQAFTAYKTAFRRRKRVTEKREGTTGPSRIPR